MIQMLEARYALGRMECQRVLLVLKSGLSLEHEETSLSRPETGPFFSDTQETKDVAQGAARSLRLLSFGEKGFPQSGVKRFLCNERKS